MKVNVIHYTNRRKKKDHVSIDTEKALDIVQEPFRFLRNFAAS